MTAGYRCSKRTGGQGRKSGASWLNYTYTHLQMRDFRVHSATAKLQKDILISSFNKAVYLEVAGKDQRSVDVEKGFYVPLEDVPPR